MFNSNTITIKIYLKDKTKTELRVKKGQYHRLVDQIEKRKTISIKDVYGKTYTKPFKDILPLVRIVEGVDPNWIQEGLGK